MRPAPHILVINGTKVRRPVFVLGAPHSGTDLLARAIKQTAGFHLTVGRPGVLRVTYAFARRPTIASERGRGAARVLRDAYAEAWQISPWGCAQCPAECRTLAGLPPAETAEDAVRSGQVCTEPGRVQRFADASPDLIYSADVLLDAFPDAQLLQVIRDGRDVVAGMLTDERCLAWFKPGVANLEEVFPNPFLGVEDFTDRSRWPKAAMAVKCALRWRGSVRLSARLRAQVPEDQLLTVRYEDLISRPGQVVETLSEYLGAPIPKNALTGLVRPGENGDGGVGAWRRRLTPKQLIQVERVAGKELQRLGYRLSGAA
ncbi:MULTISPECIES: sulfotransferase family protein [Thermomonospora]|uniref:Sulfotransferase n=1 Tax=Thermomonospora curvata (strain ATCC 19995 / DSM 43183 / JCM 3096 / KCTC 9072 / NBRC 15933 / NCIMB 10081 / Henssen B9) TaxID=471852 RepID=D1A1X2_THECD|nr:MULTISPECIES: sulfotransferase [Thermomonospora]ACY97810.1 sulfotransferase [Thermomonospora curvata DSM 43183]PKK14101.1 MAG: sulfotransferase [Thermomonospora sp. CIF 1]